MNDFQRLYERYARDLYRFALSLCGNPAEAEDLVADSFVRLWAAPGEIRDATVKAYLFTIARNLFLTRRRSAARHVPLDESLADPGRRQDDRAAASVELARLRSLLSALADTDRAALLMRGSDGLTYEEIGRALGVTAGAARVRVHRARLQLAKGLGRTLGRTTS
jgi:RNA polymerase sigma-70 factor, ECF subfamily